MNANKSIMDHMIEKINDEQMESVSGGAIQRENFMGYCYNCQKNTNMNANRRCSICNQPYGQK